VQYINGQFEMSNKTKARWIVFDLQAPSHNYSNLVVQPKFRWSFKNDE